MKLLIYYYCLDLRQDQKAAIETSLRQFEELLKYPPVEVNCEITALPGNIQKKIAKDLSHQKLKDCMNQMFCTLREEASKDRPTPRLLICCNQGHSLAKKCLDVSPTALWGLAWDGIAVVYKLDNDCAIWHELLHTLGAEECYTLPNRGPTCEHPQCIMQYATTKSIVDGCLPLCNENAKFIKERFAKFKD